MLLTTVDASIFSIACVLLFSRLCSKSCGILSYEHTCAAKIYISYQSRFGFFLSKLSHSRVKAESNDDESWQSQIVTEDILRFTMKI